MSDIARDCLELLDTYGAAQLDELDRAELERQFEEARLNDELCERALRTSYRGSGGRVMGNHLARGLRRHALQAELELSARFDDYAGYCAILTDLVHLLQADTRELTESLEAAASSAQSMSDTDLQTLVPLRDLTIQVLEVSLADYAANCRF